MATERVVWILGSGFSVPLGGPLFKDLISAGTLRHLKAWPEYASAGGAGLCAEIVSALYSSGRDSSEGSNLWADAEQFLERLDIARSDPTGYLAGAVRENVWKFAREANLQERKRGKTGESEFVATARRLKDDIARLHLEAVRFVAGASTAFLRRPDKDPRIVGKTEQWNPYRRWRDQLVGGVDSVITFNYDRALDLLSDYGKQKSSPGPALFHAGPLEDRTFKQFRKMWVPVFHMHGHVGWRLTDDKKSVVYQDDYPACAHENPTSAVIGVPGDGKLTLPDGLLKPVWDYAVDAINAASAIVIIGYRFPPTDNLAKQRLLEAIGKTDSATKVHLVLGAQNEHTTRLRGLLEWARKSEIGGNLRVHELYAEDFFTVFERSDLFPR